MSARNPVSVENSSLPKCLNPSLANEMLPTLEAKDLSQLKKSGWARVGIVAAILDEQSRLLVLKHKASDKTPAGALGPLAETAQIARTARGEVRVESIAHTLSRGIHEELGIDQPSALRLRAKRLGAWAINSWPVGVKYAGQNALAVCPVTYIGGEEQERLLDTFKETEEITGITFMPLEEVSREGRMRPGTHAWLEDVVASGLVHTPRQEQAYVNVPGPNSLPGGVDIKLGAIDYL